MFYPARIKNGVTYSATPFTQIVFVTPTVFFKTILSDELSCFNQFTNSVIHWFLGNINTDFLKISNRGKVLPMFYPFSLSL